MAVCAICATPVDAREEGRTGPYKGFLYTAVVTCHWAGCQAGRAVAHADCRHAEWDCGRHPWSQPNPPRTRGGEPA